MQMMAYKAEDRPLAEEVLEHPWFGPTSTGVGTATPVTAQADTPSLDRPLAKEKVSLNAPTVAQADTSSHDSPIAEEKELLTHAAFAQETPSHDSAMAEEKVSLQAPAVTGGLQPKIPGA